MTNSEICKTLPGKTQEEVKSNLTLNPTGHKCQYSEVVHMRALLRKKTFIGSL